MKLINVKRATGKTELPAESTVNIDTANLMV